MTGLDEDRIVAGLQVVAPKVEFDPSVAEAGGKDGGNAGKAVPIPSLFYVKKLSDRGRFGFSVIAPQGGGVNYGDDFVGRYSSSKYDKYLKGGSRPRADRDSSQSSVRCYHDCGQSGVLNRFSILFSKITPGPLAAAERLVSILPHLPAWPSDSFVDIREIPDSEACAKLYRTSQGRRALFGPYQTEED